MAFDFAGKRFKAFLVILLLFCCSNLLAAGNGPLFKYKFFRTGSTSYRIMLSVWYCDGYYYGHMYVGTGREIGDYIGLYAAQCYEPPMNSPASPWSGDITSLCKYDDTSQDIKDLVQSVIDNENLADEFDGLNDDEIQDAYDDLLNGYLQFDDDHDGISDQYDQDCPLHDQFKDDLCRVNPESCTSWDDPKNYKMWQDDYDNWLVNNDQNALVDSDGDGFSDGWENVHGYDPLDAGSCPSGTKELDAGSGIFTGDVSFGNIGNWQDADSDGDGYTDGLEWDIGSDWNDAQDNPGGEIAADWYDLDFDGDGQDNASDPNPTDATIYDPGYSPGGYTGDGTTDTNVDAPDEDDVYEDPEQYEVGNYKTNPGNFNFGDEDYDNMLGRFDSIRGNWENLRPDEQRDYKVVFNIPFPGEGVRQFDVSLVPDTSSAMGQAVDQFRQWLRIFFIALMTYWFIRNIWHVLRQY